MSSWLIVVVGSVVLVLTIVPGLWLWWPSRGDPDQRSSLGAALLTGAVVSFAVFAVQLVFDVRLRDIDERRQADQERRAELQRFQAERAALQLTVGLQPNLAGIDLHERDLSGFYLSRKRLASAVLSAANLRGANLARADLSSADLRQARLDGAHLDGANLTNALLSQANLSRAVLVQSTLTNADLSGADLSGADLTGATLQGASVGDARYDADTTWPSGIRQPRCAKGKTCTAQPLS